jgi:glucose-6-phosphate 1-dehydrogenase
MTADDTLEKCIDPCTLVILGATGNLTARKLIPALFNLYLMERLPTPFSIVGCGRTDMNDDQFRTKMAEALKNSGIWDSEKQARFLSSLYYRSIRYNDSSSFNDFAVSLREFEKRIGTGGNRIFYLALPSTLYLPVARMIGQADLASEGDPGNGWVRLVVEKPFGRDLATAVELDRGIHEYFKEHQIFRIDHYLAKETVQNVLMFRFANAIFEPLWNRRYIDSVHIPATETLGVEHRAGYYEQAGVILGIYPDERIALTFQTKTPGVRIRLRSVTMDFHYQQQPLEQLLEAYEKVLLDCLLGDHMLFWRQDGVETCWAFLTPILSACENCGDKATMLHFYESGSGGTKAIEKL